MRVKTARGRIVDLTALMAEFETTPAIGNSGKNARGDLISRNGQILKSSEEIASEYHRDLKQSVENVSLSGLKADILTPSEVWERLSKENVEPKIEETPPPVVATKSKKV